MSDHRPNALLWREANPATVAPNDDPDAVDIWRIDLPPGAPGDSGAPGDAPIVNQALLHLPADEAERARSIRHPRRRAEFALGRLLTRVVLARRLGVTPNALQLVVGAHGKPRLSVEAGAPVTGFNLTHTDGVALLAVGCVPDLGLDVESIDRPIDLEPLARRYFSPAERDALIALPEPDRRLAFFRVWTRKEAFIKALGRGLTLGLDQFDVSLAPDQPAALLATRFDPAQRDRWTLIELDCGPPALACLALPRPMPHGAHAPRLRLHHIDRATLVQAAEMLSPR